MSAFVLAKIAKIIYNVFTILSKKGRDK